MRLLYLDNGQFKLTDDLQQHEPYTILSHTWAEDEVTYSDIRDGKNEHKAGWEKLRFMAARTKEAEKKYFWVDTCCINKDSDAELATAIRSMSTWYSEAHVCFVYLHDVSVSKDYDWKSQFRRCRWLQRGWTLQELLSSKSLQFYANGIYIGDRRSLSSLLYEVTGIDQAALQGRSLDTFSHFTRLQWIAGRQTSVPEDLAYCLMGVCGISMSPMYGEGAWNARKRLEGKIIKRYGTAALEASTAPPATVESMRKNAMSRLKFDTLESRKHNIQKPMIKTCAWLVEDPTFQSWLQSEREHNGFLWIKGKPGAGKSVLMRFADGHISTHKEKDDVCVSFYFSARGGLLEKSFLGLYRALLLQLFQAVPTTQSLLDGVEGEFENNVQALQELFLKACLKLGQRRLYCFIDALDECKEEDVSQMIEYLQELGQSAADFNSNVFVCFASRHYPIIEVPTGLQLVLEDTDQHAADLKRYVSEKLTLENDKQVKQATEDILAKANGIFLWVVLVVELLRREFRNGRIHAVRKRLEQIPPGLTELFKDLISRDQEHLEEFLLCLKWILYAKRPLDLVEFYFAMMLALDEDGYWDGESVTLEQMHRFLLSSSKGLAECTQGKVGKTQFIHESVRDFLLHENGFEQIGELSHSRCLSHDFLKRCCHQGTKTSPENLRSRVTSLKPNEMSSLSMREYPFFNYARSYLLWHAEEAAHEVSQLQFMTETFDLSSWTENVSILPTDERTHYQPANMSLEYILAARGFVTLLKQVGKSENLNIITNCGYGLPLLAASANDHQDTVRLILDIQAAVDRDMIIQELSVERRSLVSSFRYATDPLKWALKHGLDSLALHLYCTLQYRRQCEQAQLHYFRSHPIPHRAKSEVEVEAQRIYNRTLRRSTFRRSMLAARSGCRKSLDRLLEDLISLDADAKARCSTELCIAAIRGRHFAVFTSLLKLGYRPDYQSALFEAVDRDSSAIVDVLVTYYDGSSSDKCLIDECALQRALSKQSTYDLLRCLLNMTNGLPPSKRHMQKERNKQHDQNDHDDRSGMRNSEYRWDAADETDKAKKGNQHKNSQPKDFASSPFPSLSDDRMRYGYAPLESYDQESYRILNVGAFEEHIQFWDNVIARQPARRPELDDESALESPQCSQLEDEDVMDDRGQGFIDQQWCMQPQDALMQRRDEDMSNMSKLHVLGRFKDEDALYSIRHSHMDGEVIDSDPPLHSVVKYRNDKSRASKVRLMLSHGADVHELDASKQTALHVAVKYPDTNLVDVARTLVEAGVNTDAKNSAGFTALNVLALVRGQHDEQFVLDTMRYLAAFKAELDSGDNDNMSAFFLSCDKIRG